MGEENVKSKLNGGIIIKAINSWAVPVVRYTAGIIECRKDQKTHVSSLCSAYPEWCGQTYSISQDKVVKEDYYKADRQSRKKSDHLMITWKQSNTKHALKAIANEELLKVNELKIEYHK